ncbi:type IV pili twitching motility protein PilT [Grimontia hollisae]|uniref:Type IV pilus (Tfp) assembly protein ATPase component PilU n=2 Tax=Grimontia hollisae TaxID=673 RepID=D0I4P8_GRIHO|nr:PilT/PilU family type 4a pilus ATPase [Grimontia hollisae]AMG30171.1 type IV pili twitching motility protein PilT [Grimontia hollisae]EEY73465.1 type IV pilus (Tfp) assembly protein ATPase component PilU [Grimontia hollisae CIP 101886]MDF2183266.1 PilT/PilU family type 4a pilus ATPase [Grimontia hollisae]STO42565.1 Twitching mobility protein [Grimontia hollisae]STO56464.1 Twitching mobility protein [Grimontia hollisae]
MQGQNRLQPLLENMLAQRASDCYITVGAACMLRVDGNLKPVGDVLDLDGVKALVDQAMDGETRQKFYSEREANFALVIPNGRFRVSAFWQRDLPGMVLRRIETEIPDIHSLGLPDVIQDLSIAKRGLVLIVGATGSGKSTSMAAMVGFRNRHRSGHILTVEDPIEFIHPHDKCIVTQREIGIDTESYEVALKNSLRQAPDMIMIGEIRTRETMEYAMQFAETGHLCIATLHANNANQALERVLHLVPKERREQFLFDLSLNLRGILAQQLVPDVSGIGRHGAYELLLNTSHVSDLIRRGELHELKETIRKGKNAGMCTFDQSLFDLFKAGKVSKEEALHHADSRNDLKLMMKMAEESSGGLSLANVSIEGR